MLQPPQPVEDCARGCETLLLTEDETAVPQSTREFLSLHGYIVLEAKSGTEALAIAREYGGPIHLMIADVVMPQMGEAKVAAELASERPLMRVLFVSGYAETTFQSHGVIDVTTRFLQKPFSLKVLARKIRDSPCRRSLGLSGSPLFLPALTLSYNHLPESRMNLSAAPVVPIPVPRRLTP